MDWILPSAYHIRQPGKACTRHKSYSSHESYRSHFAPALANAGAQR